MPYIIALIAILFLMYFPQWWISRTLNKYSNERPDFPGTGQQLAEHLVKRFDLPVTVAQTDVGDHYNPTTKQVCLTEAHAQRKSIAAVAVAAHEVSHAIQDAKQERLFLVRGNLAKVAMVTSVIGQGCIIAAPLLIGWMPSVSRLLLIGGVLSVLIATLVHLATLPVELDASFNKALPILKEGQYLNDEDLKGAKKVLRAAAFTYVAASLASLLNVWRWIRYIR